MTNKNEPEEVWVVLDESQLVALENGESVTEAKITESGKKLLIYLGKKPMDKEHVKMSEDIGYEVIQTPITQQQIDTLKSSPEGFEAPMEDIGITMCVSTEKAMKTIAGVE